jgi:hypothetical protein
MSNKLRWLLAIGKAMLAIIGAAGAVACILVWLEVKPKDVRMMTWPHWLWLLGAVILFAISLWSSLRALYLATRARSSEIVGVPGPDISASVGTEMQDIPNAVGLTTDSAEQEIAPESSPWFFKYKLRIYWTNDGDKTIHLGKPTWRASEVGIKGNDLMWRYQLRRPQNVEKPWGDEFEEIDVAPGQRCRIWLGLNPASFELAAQLLDQGTLGLLIVPVTTPTGLVDVYIRPRDRGLKQWNAHAYNEQRKCIVERFMGMDHGAKEAIRFLSFGRVMSAQRITDHLREHKFPNADKIFDSLRDDSVPLVARYGDGEFRINPTLEKIVKEVVAADKKEFLGAVSRLPADQFAYKVRNEPGFEARYNTIAPKD